MTERERFEAVIQAEQRERGNGVDVRRDGDGYVDPDVDAMWDEWQAEARIAALEAELAQARAERDRAEMVVAFLSECYNVRLIPNFFSDAELTDWSDEPWRTYLAAVRTITRGEG